MKLKSTRSGVIKTPLPVHHKTRGWIVQTREVAHYGDPAEAERFADDIRTSYDTHRQMEAGRRA